jgi:hypothetical protein
MSAAPSERRPIVIQMQAALHRLLRAHRPVSVRAFADELEVDAKTASRRIAALRSTGSKISEQIIDGEKVFSLDRGQCPLCATQLTK